MTDKKKDYSSIAPLTDQPEFCDSEFGFEYQEGVWTLIKLVEPCGVEIKTMAWKGSGTCGEQHHKACELVNAGAKAEPAQNSF